MMPQAPNASCTFFNPRSTVPNLRSDVPTPRSTIPNLRSTAPNPRSAVPIISQSCFLTIQERDNVIKNI